jgi:ribosome-associated toxin RatA of RatAB toxin-antitoxin module
MRSLTQSIVVAATPANLFALTQNYDRRLDWDPFLKRAQLLRASEPAVGVEALCSARSGLAMTTVYLSYKPPKLCAIQMTRGPWFIRQFAGSWRFFARSSNMTEVRFCYVIVGRPRFLSPLLRWIFARDSRKRLIALKKAAECEKQ